MILPTKHLAQDRALLTVGARILPSLEHPITVSALWEKLSSDSASPNTSNFLRYDAFVLALDLLFLMGTIQLCDGVLKRTKP
ncbi:MAG: ABC-three component system middle component 6 [Verrucomicrobiota bacterium]